MNLYIRLILLFLRRALKFDRLGIFDLCRTGFAVNPLDLDLNMHVNNGRYLSIMDLGRIDLMLRAGILPALLRQGYYPVVASESIRFKRSLNLWQAFTLETQIESWDERDFFVLQKFVIDGDVYATGYIKGRFRKRGQKESVPTADIFKLLDIKADPVRLSARARHQLAIEQALES